MAKVEYTTCDVCNKKIDNTTYIDYNKRNPGRKIRINDNKIDICWECFNKIERLSIDIIDEQKYLDEVFSVAKMQNDNPDYQAGYYQGIEDTLGVLSHKRLKNYHRR